MKIVIEIPDETFNRLRELAEMNVFSDNSFGYSLLAIAHGTVLPKAHGDLIDRTAILDEIALTPVAERNFNSCVECVECLPAIIKADNEVD